jgi:hypothetical protein
MKLRPIKATFIGGSRAFISRDGVLGLRLYPESGEPFEIAFSAEAIPLFQSTLERIKAALAAGERGTLH